MVTLSFSGTVAEDMRPSLECLMLLSTEMAKYHQKPVFIYAMWSFLEKSTNDHHKEIALDLASVIAMHFAVLSKELV